MSREAHSEAVAVAINHVRETATLVTSAEVHRRDLGELLLLVKEKQDQTLGLVAMAVGDSPTTESSRNALEFTQVLGSRAEEIQAMVAAVDERIKELARICDNVEQELGRYLNGF